MKKRLYFIKKKIYLKKKFYLFDIILFLPIYHNKEFIPLQTIHKKICFLLTEILYKIFLF
jgi:hypothetical protein